MTNLPIIQLPRYYSYSNYNKKKTQNIFGLGCCVPGIKDKSTDATNVGNGCRYLGNGQLWLHRRRHWVCNK